MYYIQSFIQRTFVTNIISSGRVTKRDWVLILPEYLRNLQQRRLIFRWKYIFDVPTNILITDWFTEWAFCLCYSYKHIYVPICTTSTVLFLLNSNVCNSYLWHRDKSQLKRKPLIITFKTYHINIFIIRIIICIVFYFENKKI